MFVEGEILANYNMLRVFLLLNMLQLNKHTIMHYF